MGLSAHSIRTRIALLMVFLVLITGVVYTVLLVEARKKAYIEKVDTKLLTAALLAEKMFGETYHDDIIDAESVPSSDYEGLVARNNELCRELDLSYLWSVLVLDPDKIVFTSATSPSKNVEEGDHASFFEQHSDPHAYDAVLETERTHFSTFHNKWGAGRMVLVPGRDTAGRLYMFGASVQLEGYAAMIHQTVRQAVVVGALVLVVSLLVGVLVARYLASPIISLTGVAQRMADGDLSQEIPSSGTTEIASLAHSFEVMRDSIYQKMDQLQSSEENLAITLDSIGDAVVATTRDGNISRMNRVAEKVTGWSREEAFGRPLSEVFTVINAETHEPAPNPVNRVLDARGVVGLTNQMILIDRDGNERQIADSGAPIRDSNDEIVGVVLVFRDVTREYAMRSQLQHAQKMQAIGQLAGGVAHDFNNVLMTIAGNAQLLETMLAEGSEESECVQEITSAAIRGSDLTRQLLGFARKGKQQVRDVDIHATVHEVCELLTRSLDPRVQIRHDLQAQEPVIAGDPSQPHNAFLNLALNAADAMPEGGMLTFASRDVTLDPEDCVKFRPRIEPGEYVELGIGDTGTGMSADIQHRMFEPFFTTKPQGKGTGLGLAGVYGTVETHHGGIHVTSIPDVGTIVRIVLPYAPLDSKAKKIVNGSKVIRGQGSIVVIDDDPSICKLLTGMISRLGYSVRAFEEAHAALQWYRENGDTVDLVILDERMPKLSGTQVFQRLKEINPQIRVMAISGYSDDGVADRLLEAGVLDFVSKPFTAEQLSQKIATHIGNAGDLGRT